MCDWPRVTRDRVLVLATNSEPIRLAVILLVVLASGCSARSSAFSGGQPFEVSEHKGIWASSGYGYVVDARHDRVRLYHVARDICVEEPSAGITILDFFDLYQRGHGQTLLVSSVLDPFVYAFRRATSLPASCIRPTPNTPAANFDAFATYFAEHYAFFDLYGVDWTLRTAAARRHVTRDMSDRALFGLMSELLRPLRDSHIKIEAEIDGEEVVYDGRPGKTDLAVAAWAERNGISPREAIGQFRRGYWFDDIRDSLLRGAGTIAGNGRIQYGMVAEHIGYVAVASMGGFVNGELDTAYEELSVLDAAMDGALSLFEEERARAVILDLSLNTGGYDFVGLAIAGRFAAEREVAYTKRAGDDADAKDFTIYVEPAEGRRFTGPVYVLTSDMTKSAGEVAPLAMRSLRNVRHVGERTRGSFSTVLTKYLPNGWILSLSNEVYTDPGGVVWEGKGIEPHTEIPVFRPQNPFAGHVEAVRAVIALIDEPVDSDLAPRGRHR